MNRMKIGVDVDGVLADFNASFMDIVKRLTGRDLFGPGYAPTTWNYPEALGYTYDEVSKVWDAITDNPSFWLSLRPYWDAMSALERLRALSYEHDLYFITSRPGVKAKHQTEVWLATHSGDFTWNPTVLISSNKGGCAKALQLDAYIDDRFENCVDVITQTQEHVESAPHARTFLMSRPWNVDRAYAFLGRVDALNDMLDSFDAIVEGEKVAA